jgi:poly-gamma-glutamate synthesis protein (capsule biosynthesis protein)
MYANVKSLISDADFAYINLETICAGDDYGLSGYPNFNGPTEILDALADTGFDWFSTASNHTLDAGVDGLMAEMEYLDENLPQITYTGTAKSQEQKDTPTVVEINGIKVGLASFAYGLNGYTLPEGYEYAVNLFTTEDESGLNKEAIDEVIDKLQDVSDVQIVTMHWGQEYQYEPNDLQIETANYLNEKGVDVIIGAHPHVIQPVDIIESDAGKTLVYYSLGNFISGQDRNDTMIGGMADFTLTYNEKTKEVGFEDVTFRTLVTWQSVDLRTIYTVTAEDFTDELGASSNVYNVMGDDMSLEFVNSFTHEVLKDPDFLTIISAPAGWSADSQESETEDV